jgi:hypothetical protein
MEQGNRVGFLIAKLVENFMVGHEDNRRVVGPKPELKNDKFFSRL